MQPHSAAGAAAQVQPPLADSREERERPREPGAGVAPLVARVEECGFEQVSQVCAIRTSGPALVDDKVVPHPSGVFTFLPGGVSSGIGSTKHIKRSGDTAKFGFYQRLERSGPSFGVLGVAGQPEASRRNVILRQLGAAPPRGGRAERLDVRMQHLVARRVRRRSQPRWVGTERNVGDRGLGPRK